jgi:hypothetical protein
LPAKATETASVSSSLNTGAQASRPVCWSQGARRRKVLARLHFKNGGDQMFAIVAYGTAAIPVDIAQSAALGSVKLGCHDVYGPSTAIDLGFKCHVVAIKINMPDLPSHARKRCLSGGT